MALGKGDHAAPRMRPDDPDVGEFLSRAGEDDSPDRSHRIRAELDETAVESRVRIQSRTTGIAGGMRFHDDLPPVELLEQRIELGIAEKQIAWIAGDQMDAVGLERAHRVVQLLQRRIDIGQGQVCEHPKAGGMVGHGLGHRVVGRARRFGGCCRVGGRTRTAARVRQQTDEHAALIHHLHHLLRVLRAASAGRVAAAPAGRSGRSTPVQMEVEDGLRTRRGEQVGVRQQAAQAERGDAGDQLPAGLIARRLRCDVLIFLGGSLVVFEPTKSLANAHD